MNDSRGRPRAAVTGVGVVSPLGVGVSANLEAVRAGRTAFGTIRRFDATGFNCTIAAEVPGVNDLRENNLDLFSSFALRAAGEALHMSHLEGNSPGRDRVGVLIGSGLGGCETLDESYHRLYGKGQSRLAPLTIPKSMYNAATAAVSRRFGFRGPSMTTVSACSSGSNAIGEALLWIRARLCDIVVAGAADAPLTPGIVRAWEALRVLSTEATDVSAACRPFSLDRPGIVLGEGAAVLVLESFESAARRGVEILGEIVGYGMASDAAHLTDPQVEGPVRAMRAALADSDVSPAEVDYVNAHGTGTPMNDRVETKAIRSVFADHADSLAVSSTKSLHGHAMGASGAIEAAITIVAGNAALIPPTANLRVPDPECDLDYVPGKGRDGAMRVALSSSLAFGGMNVVLAIKTAGCIAEEVRE